MAKFILSTDSGCDLTKQLAIENNIEILPMTYSIDEVDFTDTMDSGDLAVFYQKMTDGAVPRTASVSIGAYIDHFKRIAKDGLPILHITLGSGISGTYSNGIQAVEMLKNDGFENEIILIDSNCASLGYGLMALEAAKLRDEGKSADEVAKYIDETLRHWGVNKVHKIGFKCGGKESFDKDKVKKLSKKFESDKLYQPSFKDVLYYNVWRAMAKTEGIKADSEYWKNTGLIKYEYSPEIKLNIIKKLFGKLMYSIFKRTF